MGHEAWRFIFNLRGHCSGLSKADNYWQAWLRSSVASCKSFIPHSYIVIDADIYQNIYTATTRYIHIFKCSNFTWQISRPSLNGFTFLSNTCHPRGVSI